MAEAKARDEMKVNAMLSEGLPEGHLVTNLVNILIYNAAEI